MNIVSIRHSGTSYTGTHTVKNEASAVVVKRINSRVTILTTDNLCTNLVKIYNPLKQSFKQITEAAISLRKTILMVSYQPSPKDDPMERQPVIKWIREIFNYQLTAKYMDSRTKKLFNHPAGFVEHWRMRDLYLLLSHRYESEKISKYPRT